MAGSNLAKVGWFTIRDLHVPDCPKSFWHLILANAGGLLIFLHACPKSLLLNKPGVAIFRSSEAKYKGRLALPGPLSSLGKQKLNCEEGSIWETGLFLGRDAELWHRARVTVLF